MSKNSFFPKNPSLAPLNILIGKWNVTMKHVAIPTPLTWQNSFEWLENSFILWHWQGKNEVPQSTSIISRNQHSLTNTYKMFYYDSRGVSRIFDMTYENGVWKFWREDSDFYQRFKGEINKEGTVIKGEGENSHDKGKTWVHDYDITYFKMI